MRVKIPCKYTTSNFQCKIRPKIWGIFSRSCVRALGKPCELFESRLSVKPYLRWLRLDSYRVKCPYCDSDITNNKDKTCSNCGASK